MRVLTVRQPWAWAIIHGGKTVENRTRNLAGSYRGPVAIHAGLAYDEDAVIWTGPVPTPLAIDEDGSHREPRGHIIGVVDLVDVHAALDCMTQEHDGDWKVCSEWSERSGYHLVLANPRALDEPLPWKGGLGLRRLPLSVHGDALIGPVDGCTCGAGRISYQHEPMCGFELVAHLRATA
ncbi:ASCH domain-containing protein [Microbacterium testaceum]|uniref:ASCH domain-containing protein n=1 Tax=Microbacterium testaceum TaxID=2033 RepID=UPI0007348A62|nr:ASCH domain-containing protein [Microbacterium testaceum]